MLNKEEEDGDGIESQNVSDDGNGIMRTTTRKPHMD